jgi:hypothetical protein
MTWRAVVLSIGLVVLAGCSSIPVSVDYQPGYDFSQIGRYFWLPPQADPQPASVYNSELVTARVAAAVEQQLQSRGILRVGSRTEADVLITYQIGIEKLVEIDTFMGFEGSFSRHAGGLGLGLLGSRSQEYDQSTLVIDLRDPGDNRLLWRGMAERRLSQFDSPQEHAEFIQASVAAVLAKYPPSR